MCFPEGLNDTPFKENTYVFVINFETEKSLILPRFIITWQLNGL